jgi:carbon-monoxide dehydrogenase large subunit
VRRVEDRRLLTGRGRYVDDVVVPGMLHAAFVRSAVPHGRIRSVDAGEARRLPGVVAVYAGEDIRRLTRANQPGSVSGMGRGPGVKMPEFHSLATTKVRFVGDPIALVVATDRYVAEDAGELVVADIEQLEAVVTDVDALDGSKPRVWDEFDDNVFSTTELRLGDVEAAFAAAHRVVTMRFEVHRQHPSPIETRGVLASWDHDARVLTVRTATQSPHMVRMLLAAHVAVPKEQIRVMADDVGGAFGLKNSLAREEIAVVAASIDLGRPVKWVEDRFEHLVASGHAREESADVEAAVTRGGRILGVRLGVTVNVGAYPSDPFPGSIRGMSIMSAFQGPLRVEGIAGHAQVLFTNKASYVAYRGPWATGDFIRERLLDVVARDLGLDPLEMRRRNYVVPGEPPLTMLDGRSYASATTMETLDQMARLVGWDDLREHQRALSTEGRLLGIGVAAYIEGAPGPSAPTRAVNLGPETALLSVDDEGHIVVITKQQPHGQGHQTTLAQVVAEELGVGLDDVVVRWGDTDVTPVALVATGGSRAATMANGAALHGARRLREKILSLAAEHLEADPADLTIVDGSVTVVGSPSVRLPLAEVARDHELSVCQEFDGGDSGWSGGTHCCVVEVDPQTGRVDLRRYAVVEDCGIPVNPAIVEGQIRGAVAQAIGAVLLEHVAYGAEGQPLASTFLDYLLPTATDVPTIEIHHVDSILTDPDVNFRGVGEGGMLVAPATIVNAVEDALGPLGIRIREQHLPPHRILELLGTVTAS